MKIAKEITDMGDNVFLVPLQGEIDYVTYLEVKKLFAKLFAENKINLILNLEDVKYMDSSGLGAITSAHIKTNALGGSIKIVSPNRDINKVFDLTGLSKVVVVYKSVDEARKSLS